MTQVQLVVNRLVLDTLKEFHGNIKVKNTFTRFLLYEYWY